MDVPFISSGAMSRAHYALVRRVELAASASAVDQIILAEVEGIRGRFARSVSSIRQTKEYLVLLLYCSMTVQNAQDLNLEFALSHAVNLAEAGGNVQNKRIGYLYCAEMMPKDHELQLMLVNTLRKDLESMDIPRICLGLDALIQSPSEDAIPAVQERIHDLLSHNSPQVRRRALLAFRALATQSPDVLRHVIDKMGNRVRDQDTTVAGAALATCMPLLANGLVSKEKLRPLLVKLLRATWRSVWEESKRWLLVKNVHALRAFEPCRESAELLLDIVHTCSRHRPLPGTIIHECFMTLGATVTDTLLHVQSSAKTTYISSIRPLLTSQNVNDIYLFLSCLECVDPILWAGSREDVPAVLEAWEVERIIALLDTPDVSIRRKTLRVLTKVDRSLVEAHYARLLQLDRSTYDLQEKDEASRRILEVIDILAQDDGEAYAQDIKTLVAALQGDSAKEEHPLFESIVEDVLMHVRTRKDTFRSDCLGVLFSLFDDEQTTTSPTLTVILSALACEYTGNSLLPPPHLLQGLAARLSSYGAAIQDALLLSMLRISAECDSIPDSVLATVRKIEEQAGRHIRQRCDQFVTIARSKTTVRAILNDAKSPSLPDFMLALEAYNRTGPQRTASPPQVVISPERSSSRASSRASQTSGKLRYAAYDAPKPTARLRRIPSASSFAHSDTSRFVGQEAEDALSRTVTAGELTLATEHIALQAIPKSPVLSSSELPPTRAKVDDRASRTDLIALDSPFLAFPSSTLSGTSSVAEIDFEGVWHRLQNANLRGWCDSPIDVVVRRLQSIQRRMRVTSADEIPFKGDLKILVCPDLIDASDDGFAALRLREGEEDSCLWHLRCEEGNLRATIRTLLTDA